MRLAKSKRSWGTAFWGLNIICIIAVAQGWPNGAPCSTENNMTPSRSRHGKGQDWDEISNPPPFFFQFAGANGLVSTTYEDEKVYTLRLVGKSSFRGFLIQGRYVDNAGNIAPNAVGFFLGQESWQNEGIRHQGCDVGQTSVTHQDSFEKNEVVLTWKAPKATHAVQFLISVVESRSFFWVKWTPRSGFIIPAYGFDGITKLPEASSKLWEGERIYETAKGSEQLPPVLTKFQDGYGSKSSSDGKSVSRGGFDRVGTIGHAGTIGRFPFADIPLDPTVGAELGIIDEGSCASSPCYNGGTCKPGIGSRITGYTCECLPGWDGDNCEVRDRCSPSPCKHGQCVSTERSYECRCERGWGGSTCQLSCPSDYCTNGGTCRVNDLSQYSCDCVPGWGGNNCVKDMNECKPNPCMNGASCKDHFNGFTCQCPHGFVGFKCQRPCVDIYGQCQSWANEHQKCILRPLTKFFDENCPVSCKVCSPDKDIEMEGPPTIPDLDVVDWFVGEWQTVGTDNQHFPLSFDTPPGNAVGYNETMTFAVSVVPAFGAPYLNFSTIARSKFSDKDIQQSSGFLIVEPRTKPNLKCVLKSIDNNGVMMVEEASIPKDGTKELVFKSYEIVKFPDLEAKLPIKTRRTFRLDSNGMLSVETFMYYEDETSQEFMRHYTRVKTYEFYRLRKSAL